ncbi:MAG: peptidase MA family metallohydrolase [Bacillota bacterium]|jgi:hypothetical protein
MQLQGHLNHEPGWRVKTIKGTIIAALVVMGSLVVSFVEAPRSALYTAFREINKHTVSFQTRGWESIEGTNFEIRYQPQDAEIAELVLKTAEMSVEPVNTKLGFTPQGKTLVLVYPTRAALGKSFGWAADQSAMGVYWAGVIRVLSPMAWVESAAAGEVEKEFRSSGPMVHEYTHLVVDYITRGNYTRWLTEGIAQYVEREITGFMLSELLYRPGEEWFPLCELDEEFDTAFGQSKAYRQSLAMMDYLVEEYGEDTIVGILNRLGEGTSIKKAWKEELGVSLEEFEQHFNYWTHFQTINEVRTL